MKFTLDRDALIEAFCNVPQQMKDMDNWVLYSIYDDPKKDDLNHKGKYPINPQVYFLWQHEGEAVEMAKRWINIYILKMRGDTDDKA